MMPLPRLCPFVFIRNHVCYYWIYTFYYLYNKYLNGTAELLRAIQRLSLKEQWNDLSLHFITLCTLQSTVSGTRAQNHLRSIGGLETLLDGLGLPSSKFSVLKHSSISRKERCIFYHRFLLFITFVPFSPLFFSQAYSWKCAG